MAYFDALVAVWATLSGSLNENLAAINALTVPGPTAPVPVLQIMTYLRSRALWLPIKAAQATCVGAAAAVDYNSDPRVQTLDLSLPIAQAMLGDLVSHALLSKEQADEITAMGNTTLPWWQVNGYRGPITGQDLVDAGLQKPVDWKEPVVDAVPEAIAAEPVAEPAKEI